VRVSPGARQRKGGYLCPVDVPLTVLGGRWKLLIGFFLLQRPRRSNELRRLLPPISQKMLTQQLRELEADGIVVRTVHQQVPPKVEYSIAEGERARLEPLVRALADWGGSWLRDTGGTVESGERDPGAHGHPGEPGEPV
jgi:DNA-binding HxlR family transcriptional regulator